MKIGIVGSGLVGSTAAYAMVMRGVGRQIVLVDQNAERAQAEAEDISHAIPFAHPLRVQAGAYHDLAGCRVVVIAAGASQRPGESRLELLGRNALIFKDIVPHILDYAPDSILLVATNPVDVLTHLTAHYARQHNLFPGRVMGAGATLDTARFRTLLARHVGVDSQHVHAYVIGEHGDSEVLTWSLVTVGSIRLDDFCRMRNLSVCDEDRAQIDSQVRQTAARLIAGKGATYYGIGSAIARIVEVILHEQRSILTVCAPVDEVAGVQDVTLSLPNLLDGQGIRTTLQPPLDKGEQEALQRSAHIVRQAIDSLKTIEGLDWTA